MRFLERVGRWGVGLGLGLLISPEAEARRPKPRQQQWDGVEATSPPPDPLPDPTPTTASKPSGELEEAHHESGVGMLGLEGVSGGNRGASDMAAQGVQAGMRFPFQFREMRMELNGLLGVSPFQGLIGEFRLRGDHRTHGSKGTSSLVGGWWGSEVTLLRTPTLWHSLVEMPRAHIGYRYTGRGHGLEFGLRAGYALIGRYNPDGAERKLGNSITPAVYALAYSRHLYVTVDSRNVVPVGDGKPVWMGEGLGCLVVNEVSLCALGRRFSGYVQAWSGESFAASWQVGLALGLGERLGVPKE